MTRVLVTGAAGFLGRRLVDALTTEGHLIGPSGVAEPITEIILADLQRPTVLPERNIQLTVRRGTLADPDFVDDLARTGFDTLFHLASQLTLEAEKDPWKAFDVNVNSLRRLMDSASGIPRVVFTSSIAIHGGSLPDIVEDGLNPLPATTYGTHKAVNELLISDYSRLGRVDGRSLRLPIVVTRPGNPSRSVSDMIGGIIRETLRGVDVSVPLAPDTAVPIISGGAVAAGLMRMHDLDVDVLPPKRAFNLPALTVNIHELAEAVRRHGGRGSVTYAPDSNIQAIVDSWPRRFVSELADRFGIGPDANVGALIEDYLEDIRG